MGAEAGRRGAPLPARPCPRHGRPRSALRETGRPLGQGLPDGAAGTADGRRQGCGGSRVGPGDETEPSSARPFSLVPPPRCLFHSSGNLELSCGRHPLGLKSVEGAGRRGPGGSRDSWRDQAAGAAREAGAGPARKPGVSTQAAGRAARGCVTCRPGGRTHFVPGAAPPPRRGGCRARGAGGAGAGGRCQVSTFTTPAGSGVTLCFWDRE